MGCDLGADRAGSARLGVDHRRLLDDRLQHGGERAPDHVGSAARRKRIDEGDGVGRIILLGSAQGRNERGRCGGRAEHETAAVHGCFLSVSKDE
jgi:hypothetical protein